MTQKMSQIAIGYSPNRSIYPFTILSTINITYNTQSTNHFNYIYIVNNTYYTYKTKSAYNVF